MPQVSAGVAEPFGLEVKPSTACISASVTNSASPSEPPSDVTSVEIRTGHEVRPGISVQSDVNGGLPTEAIAAYEAVVAEHPVVNATLQSAYVRSSWRARDLDDAPNSHGGWHRVWMPPGGLSTFTRDSTKEHAG